MSETETFNQASFGETTNLDHHQRALVAAFSGFIFYLLIPKGIRKHFFDALPRRYAKTRNRRKKRKSKVRWSDAKSSRDSWMYAEHANKDCFLPSHANLLLDPSGCSAPPLDSPITAASMCSSYHRGLLSPKSMTQNNHHCTEKTPLLSNTKRRIAQRVSATPLSNQTSNSSRQSSPQSVASLMDRTEPTRVLLLLSSKLDDADQIQHQREAQELLQDRGVPFETADADDPINRDRVQQLQTICGNNNAVYPQCFFIVGDVDIQHLGDYHMLMKIHHAEGLPEAVRDAHDLATWEEVFSFVDTSQIFGV